MTIPGTRQLVARIIAKHVEALMHPQPVVPMPSPCQPGFMSRRQGE